MLEDAFDELPCECRRILGETRAERATLPGLLRVSTIEVDLEERLQRDPSGGMPAGARRSLPQAAGATPAPIASTSPVATARSPTAMAHRIMFARARPCVTTDTPAMPRSGADTYGS